MSDKTKKVSAADDPNVEETTTDEAVATAAAPDEEVTPEPEVAAAKDAEAEAADEAAEAEDAKAEAADEVAEAEDAKDETDESEAVPVAAKTPRPKARNVHIRTPVKDGPGKYAVIETGGKQYRVMVGDRLTVEKIAEDAGSDISFDRVLLLGGDGSTRIGTPVVDGAAVTATINDHGRGEKIVVFKYKAKKRYRRRTGHRQSQTYITITGITG